MSSLTLAVVCTTVAAVINWSTRVRPNRTLETVSKPLTTVLVMWIAIAADAPTAPTVLAVVGLFFCLLGDIALLEVIDKFIVGLVSFLIGHIVFIAMFFSLETPRFPHPGWGLAMAAVLAVHAAVVGRRIVAGAVRENASLKVPVMAYLVVIMSMAVVAAATGNPWAIAGAIAFVISDTLLGWRAFVTEKSWMALLVMMTYHAALVGLALSLM